MVKITVLPPINTQEELDKFSKAAKKKRKKQAIMGQDQVCQKCHHVNSCTKLCPPLIWINGRSPQTEIPESELPNPYKVHYKDYKDQINQLMDNNRQSDSDSIEFIRTIDNLRMKAILALKHADMTITDIAKTIHLSRSQLHRTIVLFMRQLELCPT